MDQKMMLQMMLRESEMTHNLARHQDEMVARLMAEVWPPTEDEIKAANDNLVEGVKRYRDRVPLKVSLMQFKMTMTLAAYGKL